MAMKRTIVGACLASLLVSIPVVGCGSKAEEAKEETVVQEEKAQALSFADMDVECDTRTGFFGGQHISFTVKGTVTNDTDDPINESNLPTIKWAGGKAEPDASESKLLPGESCDVSYEGEIDVKDGIPTFEFSGKVDFIGLEDAEAEINEGVKKAADGFAELDEQKQQEEAAEEERVDEMHSSLDSCKGLPAGDALEIAKETDYEPIFVDSFDVDVTSDVKESASDSAVRKALVTSVEIKEDGLFSDAKVTFTLDYVDPEAQQERDDKAAKEEQRKAEKEAEKAKREAEKAAEEEKRNAEKAAEEAEAKKDKMNLAIGETSNFKDGLSVVVTDVQRGLVNFDDSPVIAVSVTITNTGSEAQSFNELDWEGEDPNGARRSTTYYSEAVDKLNSGSLAPNGTVSGVLYFEGDVVRVIYTDSIWDDDSVSAWNI